MDAETVPPAEAPSQPANGWLGAVDAMMEDPRGWFRPRTLVLVDVQNPEADRLVTQVGMDGQNRIHLATAEPLSAATAYRVKAIPDLSDAATVPEGLYVLEGARRGRRPDDFATPCWINTLVPADPNSGIPAGRGG
ncbi:MAG: hypothetical protein HIU89_04175 [Proteobacteria bacterium]|nr:hypothetical protein [Pseudomonadota bacterium]